jgi:leucyl-tRNA synthetase
MDPARAPYWQTRWAEAELATGKRDPSREKFFALNAYPGTSGLLHVGHLRGYAYIDAFHRYHRALGHAVLFPFGVHASGLPAVTWAQRVHDRDPSVLQQLDDAEVPPEERERLSDPEYAARFLGRRYAEDLRSVGALFDESTYLTTIDDDYRAFVSWQMRALRALGCVGQGAYFASVCPVCGPVAVDPSETDLSSGGDAETIHFVLIPFRLDDGRTLLAATLRPETVYGVTNVWLAPGSELVVWHRGDEEYLVARPGAERLVEQHGGRVGHAVATDDLVGRTAHAPLAERTVPIFRSPLVDPAVGTGVVMSVPAHAPADAAALLDLTNEQRARLVDPPILIATDGAAALSASEQALQEGSGTPAERALRATGAARLSDRAAVDAATDRLYRLEFVRGRMVVPALRGVSVREARERVARHIPVGGAPLELQEFSKPVICRNGHQVVIRRVPDQWFLRYGETDWKATTKGLLARLTTWPPEYRGELEGILDWFGDRPCSRKGRWLGTPLPFDPAWIVEPIADSTFYMAYFLVRRFVAEGRITTAQLTDAFFDRAFRGLGPGEPSLPIALQDEVRTEFLYWYPLDLNLGGKEHKNVHFPVFLYAHAKLLPPELAPRGIFVNGWITGASGTKLSKKEISSKGAIPPIRDALARWGPDPLRLYYVTTAAPLSDLEWNAEAVDAADDRLRDIERLVRETVGTGAGPPELDAWLSSQIHRLLLRCRAAMDALDVRAFSEDVYVTLATLLRRYYARGGTPGDLTDRVGRAWIRLLAIVTPHVAEELGASRFRGLVALEEFPRADEFELVPPAEAREAFLDRVEADLRAVLRPAIERGEPAPDSAVFFIAAPWKTEVERWMRESAAAGGEPAIRTIMDRAKSHPEVRAYLGEIPKYVERVGPLMRGEPAPPEDPVDERATLRSAEAYLARRLGFGSVLVVPESEGEPHDPMHRRDRSRPGRPAFFLVRPPGGGAAPTDGRGPASAGS